MESNIGRQQYWLNSVTDILGGLASLVKVSNCLIIIVTEDGIVCSKKLLPMEGSMTRGSIREYTEAVRGRYLGAGKKEKGRILDEFT